MSSDHRSIQMADGVHVSLGRPLVMGILNATPDSFSDGGEISDPKVLSRRITAMLAAGVDIIDIGGESTRPGHTPVDAREEFGRVLPVIRQVTGRSESVLISIDTRKAEVASAALELGASFVNDVSGLADRDMARVVADAGCAYVAMRSGECVDPVVESCRQQLAEIVERAVDGGIPESSIIIDPGLGFGERPGGSVDDNLALIDGVPDYSMGYPVLVGASRKRFVRTIVGAARVALVPGSVGLAIRAVAAGAWIVRVHDVPETVAALAAAGLRSQPRA